MGRNLDVVLASLAFMGLFGCGRSEESKTLRSGGNDATVKEPTKVGDDAPSTKTGGEASPVELPGCVISGPSTFVVGSPLRLPVTFTGSVEHAFNGDKEIDLKNPVVELTPANSSPLSLAVEVSGKSG